MLDRRKKEDEDDPNREVATEIIRTGRGIRTVGMKGRGADHRVPGDAKLEGTGVRIDVKDTSQNHLVPSGNKGQ